MIGKDSLYEGRIHGYGLGELSASAVEALLIILIILDVVELSNLLI